MERIANFTYTNEKTGHSPAENKFKKELLKILLENHEDMKSLSLVEAGRAATAGLEYEKERAAKEELQRRNPTLIIGLGGTGKIVLASVLTKLHARSSAPIPSFRNSCHALSQGPVVPEVPAVWDLAQVESDIVLLHGPCSYPSYWDALVSVSEAGVIWDTLAVALSRFLEAVENLCFIPKSLSGPISLNELIARKKQLNIPRPGPEALTGVVHLNSLDAFQTRGGTMQKPDCLPNGGRHEFQEIEQRAA